MWAYPFQVASVSSGFPLFVNNLTFSVRSNASLDLPYQSVVVVNQTAHLVAEYNYTRAHWDFGSANKVVNGMKLTLLAATSLTEDDFMVSGESPNGYGEGWGYTLA